MNLISVSISDTLNDTNDLDLFQIKRSKAHNTVTIFNDRLVYFKFIRFVELAEHLLVLQVA